MAEGITRHKYANIEVTPDQVTPLYDNLLVRRIDDKYDGIVLTSDMTQTKDGTWVKAPDHGPRKGVVVAIGRGDKATAGHTFDGWARHEMAVRIGDTIIYPRFESSHVMLNGEMLVFVHEADVMAVVERG